MPVASIDAVVGQDKTTAATLRLLTARPVIFRYQGDVYGGTVLKGEGCISPQGNFGLSPGTGHEMDAAYMFVRPVPEGFEVLYFSPRVVAVEGTTITVLPGTELDSASHRRKCLEGLNPSQSLGMLVAGAPLGV